MNRKELVYLRMGGSEDGCNSGLLGCLAVLHGAYCDGRGHEAVGVEVVAEVGQHVLSQGGQHVQTDAAPETAGAEGLVNLQVLCVGVWIYVMGICGLYVCYACGFYMYMYLCVGFVCF
jgi:hypothetical protein